MFGKNYQHVKYNVPNILRTYNAGIFDNFYDVGQSLSARLGSPDLSVRKTGRQMQTGRGQADRETEPETQVRETYIDERVRDRKAERKRGRVREAERQGDRDREAADEWPAPGAAQKNVGRRLPPTRRAARMKNRPP